MVVKMVVRPIAKLSEGLSTPGRSAVAMRSRDCFRRGEVRCRVALGRGASARPTCPVIPLDDLMTLERRRVDCRKPSADSVRDYATASGQRASARPQSGVDAAVRRSVSSGDRSTVASSPRALKQEGKDEYGRSLTLDGSALWGPSLQLGGPSRGGLVD